MLIATIGIGLLTAVWLFIMIVLPKHPAPQASLAMSEGATELVLVALSNALPGQPVQVDRRFGNNLNLYIDGKIFEEMTDRDQNNLIEQIGRAWCANVEHSWLARVSIYD